MDETQSKATVIFYSGYKADSSSREDEEFNNLQGKEEHKETLSTEILKSIPDRVGSKKYTTYLGLADSGASGSLADKRITNYRSI